MDEADPEAAGWHAYIGPARRGPDTGINERPEYALRDGD